MSLRSTIASCSLNTIGRNRRLVWLLSRLYTHSSHFVSSSFEKPAAASLNSR